MSKFGRKKPPIGFGYVKPTLDALESELKERNNDSIDGKTRHESLWTVHQINWQRTRYIFKLYTKYKRIDRKTYDYCLNNGYADKNLISKWKKSGYEKLCSTFVVDSRNFPFKTVSVCRVPKNERFDENKEVKCSTTGCLGCYSGTESLKNIFGNKYGQNLARIQVLRERKQENKIGWLEENENDSSSDSESEEEEQIKKKMKLNS